MRPFAITSIALAAVAAVPLAFATVALDATVDTYEVRGTTFNAIMRSLNENAPFIERTQRRHYGVTRISFTQEATFQETRAGCELLSNDIDLRIEMMLPEWVDRDDAPEAVAVKWDRLSESIARHEEQHVAIAQEYLRRMRNELDRAMTAPSCPELRVRIRDRMEALVEAHRAAQEAFDERVSQENASGSTSRRQG